jgi:hypothetical protein
VCPWEKSNGDRGRPLVRAVTIGKEGGPRLWMPSQVTVAVLPLFLGLSNGSIARLNESPARTKS